MDTILACETLRPELEKTMRELDCNTPVQWIEAGLHDNPDKLRGILQDALDAMDGVENALLCFTLCGKAVLGLTPRTCRMVVPRAEDCITLLLGSNQRRRELEPFTYFFTPGWLTHSKNLFVEYDEVVERFDEKRADIVYQFLMDCYDRALVVDTKTGALEPLEQRIQDFTDKFNLKREYVEGDLSMLRKLLTHQWDDDFVIVEPGETLTEELFTPRDACV